MKWDFTRWLFPVGASVGFAAVAARRASEITLEHRHVIITGGSRGLGLAMARQLAEEGARLTLLARDAEELKDAAASLRRYAVPVHTIACDVRDRTQVEDAVDEAVRVHGRLDVVINNAGVIEVGPVQHMDIQDFVDAMDTHFYGPLYMTLAALPHLKASGHGRIVNIASIGGKVAVPHLLPYTASKFALVGLSDGMRNELAREGIRVTTVAPGLIRTGSPGHAIVKGRHRQEFAWFAISDALPGITGDADRAARRIIQACRRGEAEVILTPPAVLLAHLANVFPGVTAATLRLVNRILPAPTGPAGDEAREGFQSGSTVAPSVLTVLADRAAQRNNERPRPA